MSDLPKPGTYRWRSPYGYEYEVRNGCSDRIGKREIPDTDIPHWMPVEGPLPEQFEAEFAELSDTELLERGWTMIA